MTDRVVVERLRVRVHGGDAATARELGLRVAAELADRLRADSPTRDVELVRVRMHGSDWSGGAAPGVIADAVARALR